MSSNSNYEAVRDILRNRRAEEVYRYHSQDALPVPYHELAYAYLNTLSEDGKKEFKNMDALEQTRAINDSLNKLFKHPKAFSSVAAKMIWNSAGELPDVVSSTQKSISNRENRLSSDKGLVATQKIKDAAGASDMSDADLRSYLYDTPDMDHPERGTKTLGVYSPTYPADSDAKYHANDIRFNNISTFYNTDSPFIDEPSSKGVLKTIADTTKVRSYLGSKSVSDMLNTRKANQDYFVEHPAKAVTQTLIGKGSELLGIPFLDQSYQAKKAGLKDLGSWNPLPEGVSGMGPWNDFEYAGHAGLDLATLLPPGKVLGVAGKAAKAVVPKGVAKYLSTVVKPAVIKRLPETLQPKAASGGRVFTDWGEKNIPVSTIAENPSFKTTEMPTAYGGSTNGAFDKAERLLTPVAYGAANGLAGWVNTTPDADVDLRSLNKGELGENALLSTLSGAGVGTALGFAGRLLAGKARAGGLSKEGVKAGTELDKTVAEYNKNAKEMDTKQKQSNTFRRFENALDDPYFRNWMSDAFSKSPVYAPNARVYDAMLKRNDAYVLKSAEPTLASTNYPSARVEDPVQTFELGSGTVPAGDRVAGNLLQNPVSYSPKINELSHELRKRIQKMEPADASKMFDDAYNWTLTNPELASNLEAAQKFGPWDTQGTIQQSYASRLGLSPTSKGTNVLPDWVKSQSDELGNQGRRTFYSNPAPSILPDGDAARTLASMEKTLSGQSPNTNPSTGVSDDVERIGNLMFGTKNLTPDQRKIIRENIILRDSPALMSTSALDIAKNESERRNALMDWRGIRSPAMEKTILEQFGKWQKSAKPTKGSQATAGAGFFVPGMIARATVSEPEAETQFQKSGETTPGAEYYFPRTYRFPMIGDTKIPAGTAYYNNEALKLGGVGRYVIDPDWMTNDPDAQ